MRRSDRSTHATTSGGPDDTGAGAPPSRSRDPLVRVVEFLRTRKGARRALSILSILMLLGGLAALGYPFYTNLYQDRVQSRLNRELASPELEQKYREGRLEEGDSLTRIKI